VHRIYVPGAGTALRHTVRDMRSDREMTIAQLRQELVAANDQLAGAKQRATDVLSNYGIASLDLVPRADGSGAGGLWGALGLAWYRMQGKTLNTEGMPPEVLSQLQLSRLEIETLERRKASLEVEWHKKFALAFACVVFVLIGAPLGMRVKRGGVAVGFLSILFFAFYYLCLQFGESFADRLLLPPWLAMWLANLVLGGWGLFETLRVCEVGFGRGRKRYVAPAAVAAPPAPSAPLAAGSA
jgi:lipopolysaccharide export system permease protein